MKFRTVIDIPESTLKITHRSRMMMIGSCFAENIGKLLIENKFNINVNPFGILYNPASISRVLQRIKDAQDFTESDLQLNNDLYISFLHHGAFSRPEKSDTLKAINESLSQASDDLKQADTIIITFGTAWIYKLKSTGKIVANCHKFPSSDFYRERLTIDEIVNEWKDLIQYLSQEKPELNFLFTVSPIRHWKDGAHENQLSKSILLLAIDKLQKSFENIFYFPSYEIVLDELRDYRFYTEDMLHPSNTAINYIWEVFGNTYFDELTYDIIKQWKRIYQAVNHRPINRGTEQHKQFLIQTLLKLNSFQEKYPYLDCNKEKKSLDNQLK